MLKKLNTNAILTLSRQLVAVMVSLFFALDVHAQRAAPRTTSTPSTTSSSSSSSATASSSSSSSGYRSGTTVNSSSDSGNSVKATNVGGGPNNERNADGTKKKTANQGIAQGLSVAETSLLKENPFSFYLSQSAQRGMVEFVDTIDSNTSLSLNYRLNSWSSLGLSAGYNTIIYKKDGELFNNQDPDPQQYGFDDTEVSYVLPNVWSDKYNRLLISNSVTLPTSRASSRATMNVAARSAAILRYRPTSRIIITPSVGGYVRDYHYDTVNDFGTAFNSPLGVNYGLAGSYVFKPWLTGSVSYGQTQRYDYNQNWRVIQSASIMVSLSIESINLYVGYNWRDTVLSNESLFDNDRSIIYTGVGYAF